MITVGSTTLPNPAKMTWGENDLSSEASGRNLQGEMLKDLVAKKVKIEVEWGPLTPAQSNTILTAITASVYLQVTYPDAKAGTNVTKTMYVGDRSSEVLLFKVVGGVQYWSGLKVSFIEK